MQHPPCTRPLARNAVAPSNRSHPHEPANSGEASEMAAASQPVPTFLYW